MLGRLMLSRSFARISHRLANVACCVTYQWAAAGLVDTNLSFFNPFELYRADVSKRGVPTLGVVEALDVVEHV